jgi:hypothetical protein
MFRADPDIPSADASTRLENGLPEGSQLTDDTARLTGEPPQEDVGAPGDLNDGRGQQWRRVGSRWELVRRKQDQEESEQPPREGRRKEDEKHVSEHVSERWEKVNGRWQLRRQMSNSSTSADQLEIIPVIWLNSKQNGPNSHSDHVATNITAVINGRLGLNIDGGWQQADSDGGWQQPVSDDGWQQPVSDGGWQQAKSDGGWQQVESTGLWDVQRRDTRAVAAWTSAGDEDEIDGGGGGGEAVWEPSRQPEGPPLLPRSGRFLSDSKAFPTSEEESLEDNSIEDKKVKVDEKSKKKKEEEKENEEEEGEEKKPPKLNVSDKDSPYALLDKYFPERESYFYQNRHSFKNMYGEGGGRRQEIGNLQPKEVSFIFFILCLFRSRRFRILRHVFACSTWHEIFHSVLLSRSRKEPHHLVRAGAVTRCGCSSGSDGSGYDNGKNMVRN